MSIDAQDRRAGARKLQGAMLDQPGLSLDRLPGLPVALERFALEAQKGLAELTDGPLKAAAEETRATTLFQTLLEAQGLTAALYTVAEFDAKCVFVLDEAALDVVIHAVFGADLAAEANQDGGPQTRAPLTAIEASLVADFARLIGEALGRALAPLATASVVFERLSTLAGVHLIGRRDMPAIVTRLAVTTGAGACGGVLLLPQSALLPLREALAEDPAAAPPPADPGWAQRMEAGVTQTRLPVVAVLEELPLTLADVANLEVGDVLDLKGAGVGRVRLDCAGRRMFWCKLGERDGRYALEIDEPIVADAEPASARSAP